MPRKDLEDFYFKLLEQGKSIEEVEAAGGKGGWGAGDMWHEWALDAAIKRYHKKHGKSDEMKRAEFFYFVISILLVVFLMAYFSRPRS
ncbi:MAG: hypothetical protein WC408_01000 [Candidatus Micrarchaeia archaeon]|jgi:hypothetical protein